MTTNTTTERVARDIVDAREDIIARDTAYGDTVESVVNWYAQEAVENGDITWDEVDDVVAAAARIWDEEH